MSQQIGKCQCDCKCSKFSESLSGSPLQCDDCDNGIHYDEIKKVYVNYEDDTIQEDNITMDAITINLNRVTKILESVIPSMKEITLKSKTSGEEVYFSIMVLLYLNQIAAQENGVPQEKLKALELAAGNYIKAKGLDKKWSNGFYN